MLKNSFYTNFWLLCFVSMSIFGLSPVESKEQAVSTNWNAVEKVFLEKSGRQATYPGELLPLIETSNVCELGQLAALSFLLWVNDHPEGVVALPTGRTPEFFIKYLEYYKNAWGTPEVQRHLRERGIFLERFPETRRLKFVQLDEFYPIDKGQSNSFTAYVEKYYLPLLEILPENVLTMESGTTGIDSAVFPQGKMDLSLCHRQAVTDAEHKQKQELLKVERFCAQYEETIRRWGGIGFFLGGIGPDGHIAFNMPDAPFDSKTRLVQLNYPSAAAAAVDLGGIEFSRDKTAITIGLGTITFNKEAVAIILAAGEVKAPVVASALTQKRDSLYPATALRSLKGARFYVTKGAASLLPARQAEKIAKKSWNDLTVEEIDEVVIALALQKGKRIVDLNNSDFSAEERSSELIGQYSGSIADLLQGVQERLIRRIDNGLNLPKGVTILHTAPHHDDIALSYHPLLHPLLEGNRNHFAYFTSGFNSVANGYVLETLDAIPGRDMEKYDAAIFRDGYETALRRYLAAAENHDEQNREVAESILMLRNVAEIFGANTVAELNEQIHQLKVVYFPSRHPGEKDSPEVQRLKGTMRESESERMLLMDGAPFDKIHHLRTTFYTGDQFDPMPTIADDARPFQQLCEKIRPEVVTVAFDPEGTGPDTHYKVLQVVAQTARMGDWGGAIKVWGYRNVWHRFAFSEANLMAPVTEQELAIMDKAFLSCFSTQKSASFPAPNFDGPFSGLAEKIQRDQYEQLRTLLGAKYFSGHPDPRMRNARGFVLIREMGRDEFVENARELSLKLI